jgi:hypothetical protein
MLTVLADLVKNVIIKVLDLIQESNLWSQADLGVIWVSVECLNVFRKVADEGLVEGVLAFHKLGDQEEGQLKILTIFVLHTWLNLPPLLVRVLGIEQLSWLREYILVRDPLAPGLSGAYVVGCDEYFVGDFDQDILLVLLHTADDPRLNLFPPLLLLHRVQVEVLRGIESSDTIDILSDTDTVLASMWLNPVKQFLDVLVWLLVTHRVAILRLHSLI